MARRRKGPWRRKGKTTDNHWYTTIGKQTVKVADGNATYQEAYGKYVQILADNGDVEPDQFTFKNLAKRFLDWSKANRKPATHAFYERYLNSFAAYSGNKQVRAIRLTARVQKVTRIKAVAKTCNLAHGPIIGTLIHFVVTIIECIIRRSSGSETTDVLRKFGP